MIPREITNAEDIIDSRDLIRYRDWLMVGHEDECDDECDHTPAEENGETGDCPDGCLLGTTSDCEHTDGRCSDPEEHAEAEALSGLIADIDYAESGQTLIRESHFEDYARQYAEDIGAISDDARWPATCIDWEQAAHELQQDFTPVEWDGVTYYYSA